MGAMETEGVWERGPEVPDNAPDGRGFHLMRAADITVMLAGIRTSLLEGASGVASRASASAVSELEAFFWAYLRLVQAHPGLFSLLRSSEKMRHRSSRVQIRIEYEGFIEWIRQLIATGIRNGSIRNDVDPRPLALLLMGMLEALTTRWLLSDGAGSLEEPAESMWQTFRALIALNNGGTRAEIPTAHSVR